MFRLSLSNAVKTFGVGCQDRFLVCLIDDVSREQFVDLAAERFRVETLVREVGRENKRSVCPLPAASMISMS